MLFDVFHEDLGAFRSYCLEVRETGVGCKQQQHCWQRRRGGRPQ